MESLKNIKNNENTSAMFKIVQIEKFNFQPGSQQQSLYAAEQNYTL